MEEQSFGSLKNLSMEGSLKKLFFINEMFPHLINLQLLPVRTVCFKAQTHFGTVLICYLSLAQLSSLPIKRHYL